MTATTDKKITMNKIDESTLLDLVLGQVAIPKTVKVVDYQNGDIDRGDKGLLYWANLQVVDTEQLAKLASIGMEDNADVLKLKLANYDNQNLADYVGTVLDVSNAGLVFTKSRATGNRSAEINGVAFRQNFDELEVIKK
ncbi:hypothetical protein [Liquorilactobacillus satsumensis]|uniref:hypothetical protein n=1 Tax=Liquorilactobacillus satsumensis TaxID=259059 RepID=UPI0039EAC233